MTAIRRRQPIEHRGGWLPGNRGRSCEIALCVMWLCCLLSRSAAAGLSDQIDGILSDPCLSHGVQGVVIKSLKTGSVLYERNPDMALVPGSCLKLLVSCAALERLGPDYRYHTKVFAEGTTDSAGVLSGNIIIKGGGDPVLNQEDLKGLAKKVSASGVRRVTGNVIVDDSLFDAQRLGCGWSWDYLSRGYAAQISALNCNENAVDVYVLSAASAGGKATVRAAPATDYVRVFSTAITGEPGSENSIEVDREIGENVICVSGSIPRDYKAARPQESVSVDDPALFTGHLFLDELSRVGVEVGGGVSRGILPRAAKCVGAHASPALSEVLCLLNKPSDNLIAEVLLKTLGAMQDEPGTAAGGIRVESDFLKEAGLDCGALNVVDGSGLSRLDFISARNLVTLLGYMYSSKQSRIFVDSLPTAGVDGTLKARMKSTLAAGNLKAKTGYVRFVSSIAGYVSTRSGEPLAFAIIMNNQLCTNTQAKRVQDRICALLAEMR